MLDVHPPDVHPTQGCVMFLCYTCAYKDNLKLHAPCVGHLQSTSADKQNVIARVSV